MRYKGLRKALTGVFVAVVLAGLSYSVSVLLAKPVLAASCDCAEEKQVANDYCIEHYRSLAEEFVCPVGDYIAFYCPGDPEVVVLPCN